MNNMKFDAARPFDLIPLGRITIDLNPVDYFHPLSESTTFKKYVGGSPANVATGLARLGKKVGFFGKISDDQFGDFAEGFFQKEGIDTSHITRCRNGEKMGLTFTEILSETESSILMYRNCIADLQLCTDDIDESYLKQAKALLISGTALAESPSREAALKAMFLAKRNQVKIIFDLDYRPYGWNNTDEISIYYAMVAENSDIIMGSREEYNLMEKLVQQNRTDLETANYWMSRGSQIVIIKHGKKGSTAYTQDGECYSIKPFPIKALKSFGGGDGYGSAFLYGIFEGLDIIDCLELGSASASLLVASHGCSPDMPDITKLRTFIAECKQQYGEMIARA